MRFNIHHQLELIRYWLRDSIGLFRFYRLKMLFSLISIVIGIAAMTTLVALKCGVNLHVQQLMSKYEQTRFVVTIAHLNESLQRTINHTGKDFNNDIWQFNSIDLQLVPYHTGTYPVAFDFKPLHVNTLTISMPAIQQMRWTLSEGRLFSELDKDQKVALIGSEVANKIKSKGVDPLQHYISINAHYFKIIGILNDTEYDPLLDFELNNSVLIGFEWLYRFQQNPTLDTWIAFSNATYPEAKILVEKLFIQKFGAKQIYIRDLQVYHEALFNQIYFTLKILAFVAIITLVLGIISILNLLFVLLSERKNEVGLRLALGATSRDIGIQFLREALLLNMLGAVLGMIIGQGIAFIVAQALAIHYYFIWQSIVIGLMAALLFGLIIGLIPARMAAKLRPFAMIQG